MRTNEQRRARLEARREVESGGRSESSRGIYVDADGIVMVAIPLHEFALAASQYAGAVDLVGRLSAKLDRECRIVAALVRHIEEYRCA